jgi:arylsulfatase A-like enzyme
VPLIANWPGVTPPGRVLKDLVDFSDMYPTFAEIAGAPMPTNRPFDGRSYAPQLRGQTGKPREWVYVQSGNKWYVRSPRWKLTHSGELFDMTDAPFVEKPVAADSTGAEARAARAKLQKVLDALNPAGGKVNKP